MGAFFKDKKASLALCKINQVVRFMVLERIAKMKFTIRDELYVLGR